MYSDDFEKMKELIHEGEYPNAHNVWQQSLEFEHQDGYNEGSDDALCRLDEMIDDEIKGGYADDGVKDRARKLGMDFPPPDNKQQEDLLQEIHVVAHPTGPYYWTFCAKCN